MLRRLLLVTTFVLIGACGRSHHKESSAPAPEHLLAAPANFTFGRVHFQSKFPVQTVPGTKDLLLSADDTSGVYHVSFEFLSPAEAGDTYSAQTLRVDIGPNHNGQSLKTASDIFMDDQQKLGRRLDWDFQQATLVASQTLKINGADFVYADYEVKKNMGNRPAVPYYVRCWYGWVSQYRSLIVSAVSNLPFTKVRDSETAALSELVNSLTVDEK